MSALKFCDPKGDAPWRIDGPQSTDELPMFHKLLSAHHQDVPDISEVTATTGCEHTVTLTYYVWRVSGDGFDQAIAIGSNSVQSLARNNASAKAVAHLRRVYDEMPFEIQLKYSASATKRHEALVRDVRTLTPATFNHTCLKDKSIAAETRLAMLHAFFLCNSLTSAGTLHVTRTTTGYYPRYVFSSNGWYGQVRCVTREPSGVLLERTFGRRVSGTCDAYEELAEHALSTICATSPAESFRFPIGCAAAAMPSTAATAASAAYDQLD